MARIAEPYAPLNMLDTSIVQSFSKVRFIIHSRERNG